VALELLYAIAVMLHKVKVMRCNEIDDECGRNQFAEILLGRTLEIRTGQTVRL
jgi:hypothetical protein